MTSTTHRITNRTSGKLLGEGVSAVNGTFDHLTVLRVLIEGLADNNERGLWLTEVQGIPTVPRISPFDLIYMDDEQRVVEAVELLPAGEQPLFRKPAVSALVLPFQTISATETRVGDQLAIIGAPVEEQSPEPPDEVAPAEALPAPPSMLAIPAFAAPIPVPNPAPVPDPVPVVGALPAVPPFPAPVVRPAPEKPRPVLTVHEVVLPEERIPAPPAASVRAQGRNANVKKNKGPGARKARREVVRAQKKMQDDEAARQRRTEGFLAAEPPAPQASAPLPLAVLHAASILSATGISSSKTLHGPLPHTPFATAVPAPLPAPAAVQTVPVASAASAAKKVPERGSVMALVNRVLRWLNPTAIDVEQRDSIRRPTRDLVAYVGSDDEKSKLEVANISSSGVYLRTGERWEPGTKVALSLQHDGPPAETPEERVEVEAHAVRHGADGVGLAFVLPQGMQLDLWESAASGEAAHSGPGYIVHEMRLAQALGLIRSICPQAVDDASILLRKEFSTVRVRDVLRLLQVAQKMLSWRANQFSLRAPAPLVLRILEMGSWASEDWTQELWAGMLVTSCTPDGNDQTNVEFVELLSQLAPVHLRILELAATHWDESSGTSPEPPSLTLRELTRLLDLSNLTKTLRSVGEMSDRGLMTPPRRPISDSTDDNARTSVTALGLELHARCHGRLNA